MIVCAHRLMCVCVCLCVSVCFCVYLCVCVCFGDCASVILCVRAMRLKKYVGCKGFALFKGPFGVLGSGGGVVQT